MSLLAEFTRRSAELNKYIEFVRQVDAASARFQLGAGRRRRIKELDPEIRKVLRASYFLLAYNCVEAITRDSLSGIYAAIDNEKSTFPEILPALQKALVKQRLRRAVSGNAAQEALFDDVVSFSHLVLSGEYAKVADRSLPVSGNVDNAFIRDEICNRFKIRYSPARSTRDGVDLKVIKDYRNSLAHGNVGFADVGRDFIASDLAEINKRLVLYISAFARNADSYIGKRKYLA